MKMSPLTGRTRLLILTVLIVVHFQPIACALVLPRVYKSDYTEGGDINLGLLISIKEDDDNPDSVNICSDEWYSSTSSLAHSEMLGYAVRAINRRDDLLPNITLGFVVKNSCSKDLNALARSMYFIPNHEIGSCGIADEFEDGFIDEAPVHRKVAGVIGPGNSREAVMVAPLMSAAQIPIISPYASSDELSDKKRFEYFLRLVPPDGAQIRALLDIARYFGWTYIAAIYTDGSYGEYGFKAVESVSKEYGICIGYSKKLSEDSGDEDFEDTVAGLKLHHQAKVVVVFGSRLILRAFITYVGTYELNLNRIWLGGDTQCSYKSYPIAARAIAGLLCIGFPGSPAPGFKHFIGSDVSPWTRPNNPWVRAYWETHFKCSWGPNTSSSSHCDNYTTFSGGEYGTGGWYSGKVWDGVHVFANAIHDLISVWCPKMISEKNGAELEKCVTGPRVLDRVKNVSIDGLSQRIEFGEDSELLPHYLIYQLTYDETEGVYKEIKVAEWLSRKRKDAVLSLDLSVLNWDHLDLGEYIYNYTKGNVSLKVPDSQCSRECGPKQYKIRLEQKCCWNCHNCQVNAILINNATSCEVCDDFMWPDSATQTICEVISLTYLQIQDQKGIALAIMAGIGALSCIVIILIFAWKRSTKLVKATNKQLTMVILVGGALACGLIFVFMVKPTSYSCGVRQIGFHFTVSLLYCPIFVKTNRIYRIFSGGKKGVNRPRFISAGWQVVFTTTAIGIQVVILIATTVMETPFTVRRMPIQMEKLVEISCGENLVKFILPLAYNVLMIITCAVLGYRARKLPENFNESWYIFISVSTTLFMWIVFLPSYFTSFYANNQVAILGFCLLVNVYITIGCLFMPRIYALFCIDEKSLAFNTTMATQSSVGPAIIVLP